jgi:hypothetical protein
MPNVMRFSPKVKAHCAGNLDCRSVGTTEGERRVALVCHHLNKNYVFLSLSY